MKAIACVVLMIGLLKFAQEAPDLLKSVFNFGGDLLKGMDLNPKGQIGRDIKSAAKTATAPGKAAMNAFKQGTGTGIGAIQGARAGFGKGKDAINPTGENGTFTRGDKVRGFFGGVAGGARGLVAGGTAGKNSAGFSGAAHAGTLAGRNAVDSKASAVFGTSQGYLNKGMEIVNAPGKSEIDKQKDEKKTAKAAYNSQVADYVNSKMSNEEYVNQFINNSSAQILNDKVAAQAAANNTTENAIRNNAAIMNRLSEEAYNEGQERGLVAAREAAQKNAESIYKAQKDALSSYDDKISEEKGKQIKNSINSVQQIVDNFAESQEKWGDKLQQDFNSNLSEALGKIKAESYDGKNISSVFGKEAKAVTLDDLKNVIANSSDQKASKETYEAIAAVMDKVNSTAKTMNTNLTIASQVLTSQQAAAQASGGEKKDK